jgi:hypothetical protein
MLYVVRNQDPSKKPVADRNRCKLTTGANCDFENHAPPGLMDEFRSALPDDSMRMHVGSLLYTHAKARALK